MNSQMSFETPRARPRVSSTPSVILGACAALLSAAAIAYLSWEMFTRTTLGVGVDDPGTLLWVDVFAAVATMGAAVLLLLPGCCAADMARGRVERRTAAFLLLTAAIATSITSRVRDLNISVTKDEAYACGRRDARDACPTQRVQISTAFAEWREGNENVDVCWLNTSAAVPEAFVWGAQYADATNLPTADFADPATYELHPEYAPCFYYACSAACLPEQREHNERLLRFETLATAVVFVGVFIALCVRSPGSARRFEL